MSFVAASIQAFEGAPLPDVMRRAAIRFLVSGARKQAAGAGPDAEARFACKNATAAETVAATKLPRLIQFAAFTPQSVER